MNRVFKNKTQRVVELDGCTVHMKNKSDLEHAQLTRGPDRILPDRILPDLVSSSPFPSPTPFFLPSNRQNEIWGRDQLFCCLGYISMTSFQSK